MLELWHKRTLSHFTFRRLEASRYRRTATTTQCVECKWCRLIIHLLLKISSEFNSILSISQRNSQSRMNDMSVLSIVVSWTLSSPEFREWRMRITKSRSSWISRKTLRVNCFSWIRCRCRIGQVHMAFNENIPAKRLCSIVVYHIVGRNFLFSITLTSNLTLMAGINLNQFFPKKKILIETQKCLHRRKYSEKSRKYPEVSR